MLDEQDQGTRIGVGVSLGVVLLLIVGLVGWLTMRGHKSQSAPAVQSAPAPAPKVETPRVETPPEPKPEVKDTPVPKPDIAVKDEKKKDEKKKKYDFEFETDEIDDLKQLEYDKRREVIIINNILS